MRKVYIAGLIAAVILFIGIAAADEVTISTYYPAPHGSYNDLVAMNSVGIGTTNPEEILHVKHGTNDETLALFEGNRGRQMRVTEHNTDVGGIYLQVQDSTEDTTDNANSRTLILQPGGGNVGIGTSNPATNLEIATGDPWITLDDTNSAGGTGAIFEDANNEKWRITLDTSGATAGWLRFTHITNGDVLSLDNTGNVGIGTTAPDNPLHINYSDSTTTGTGSGQFNYGLQIENTDTTTNSFSQIQLRSATVDSYIRTIYEGSTNIGRLGFFVDNSNDVIEALSIANDGDVGIATLSSNGAVYSNGTYLTNTDPSSRDYKENIKPIDLQAERLLKLTPKSFTWKDNEEEDIGYIAEEVWEVLPELRRDDGTTKGYASAKLPLYTIELVKNQQEQIDNLKSEIETLKAKLNQ